MKGLKPNPPHPKAMINPYLTTMTLARPPFSIIKMEREEGGRGGGGGGGGVILTLKFKCLRT